MNDEHFDHVAQAIARDMVTAGLSALIAPTPAKEAARRIIAGEASAPVIRELVQLYGASEPATKTAEAITMTPEPKRRVLSTVAGAYPARRPSR